MRGILLGALIGASFLWCQDDHQHHEHMISGLGSVSFPTSCTPAAQAQFTRAVALLHSFGYEEARRAFLDTAASDPGCAMAHWGVAMTWYHQIWAPPPAADLEQGAAASERANVISARTSREKDYIEAIRVFYKDWPTASHRMRATAYEHAMEGIHQRYPTDDEGAIFYALAILGNLDQADRTYAKQKDAPKILNEVLPRGSHHPGVAHYLIHSDDYPALAELALPAARAYATIAPGAPHALHMPSHIFTRLGLWDDSIASNLASAEKARSYLARVMPGAASFDELHAVDYLVYAYLQRGENDKALALRDQLARVARVDVPNFAAAYALAAVPARCVLERRQWKEAAALTVPAGASWEKFPYAEANIHFAAAIGAARSNQLDVAKRAVDR